MAAQPVFNKPVALVLHSFGARRQRYSLGPFISVQQGMREDGSASTTSAILFTGTVLSKHEQPVNTACYPEYQVLLGSYGRGARFQRGKRRGGQSLRGEGEREVRVSLLSCLPFSLLFSSFPQKRLILRLTSFRLARPPSLRSDPLFYATSRAKT